MEVIVFEKAAYWKMQEKLISMFEVALKNAQPHDEEWISTQEAMDLLGVRSKSKMQELRNTNAIKYSKFGHKLIRYSKPSLMVYLKRNIPSY